LKIRYIIFVGLVLPCLVFCGCLADRSFSKRLSTITKPYKFGYIGWECEALGEAWFGPDNEEADAATVNDYFNSARWIAWLQTQVNATDTGNVVIDDIKLLEDQLDELKKENATRRPIVEDIVSRQVIEVLSELDIYHPYDGFLKFKTVWPPPTFLLEDPPHLLVVSPRDRIESIREIMLRQDVTIEEMEQIEALVDELEVSSLVVTVGGFAAYPSFVSNRSSIEYTLSTVVEEWVHKYLAFTPLGFRYVLDLAGIARNYDIATMNETAAGMFADEVSAIIYDRYYNPDGDAVEKIEGGFDFNKELREIRRVVDVYLAKGEIEKAEEFMEEKRLFLAENSYYIRKLNQAYFAFHGAYADSPTSISPIGVELREVRAQSTGPKEFLDTVAAFTSREDLREKGR